MRDIVTAMEADEEIGNIEEEQVVIIEEIAEIAGVKTDKQVTSSQRYRKKIVRGYC